MKKMPDGRWAKWAKLAKTGRQTTQEIAQPLELSVTGRVPKEAKRNRPNRTISYYKKKTKVCFKLLHSNLHINHFNLILARVSQARISTS